jgi:hypothetical protein
MSPEEYEKIENHRMPEGKPIQKAREDSPWVHRQEWV